MRVGYIQFKPEFGRIKHNLDHIASLVHSTDADLLVLPELCTTGYLFQLPEEVANLSGIIPDGSTVQWFIQLCKEKNCTLAFGMAERHRDYFYNSAVLVGPSGYIGTYRKTHLYDREKELFRKGDTGFRVWRIGSVTIGMMICFDWFFPESMRVLMLRGAQIVCHPANLVLPYCQNAMQTRCLENGVFAITANRIGSEMRGESSLNFTGASQIVDPKGAVCVRASSEDESVQVIDIDPCLALDKSLGQHNDRIRDREPHFYHDLVRIDT